jgi:hypothetical protein
MEEMVNEIVTEIMGKLKYKTKFWSPHWKRVLHNRLSRKVKAHLLSTSAVSGGSGKLAVKR